ncbi:DUF1254 domain-containing protein [Mycobacterium sp. CVI_P3]|uniref:DUF1254 domain-containing protein n=1 Tax=Mycobacterium pinniadriaticum TaxID=2994102 RepID=A0ABT3SG81_9MYCO|nr:DUF1254 domain-containing protein [Mycobacterium pinniadriaticum]MCX2932077.1 DUF1254 domain-containing protein [Mycobacterium pinniadriaticum]MCX2938501.1 DUF1254 domain-containing protein [Mycobacterium pinniadriaticum]
MTPSPAEIRAIEKAAYTYGFPMVDSYRIQYSYFVDTADPEYKGTWNRVHSSARVYTPADTAVQTPNSDTPYSMLGADLRTEPLVLTVPAIEEGRYYSLQFVDGYTYNFAYVGSRTTGNSGGRYLLAGPGWTGGTPAGIDAVITSLTEFALVIYRTQLFGPDDLDNVRAIQAGYRAQPLSAFLNRAAPAAAPAPDFPTPLSAQNQKTSPTFFELLDFTLRFAPALPSEQALRARLASIGLTGDGTFDAERLDPEIREAMQSGMADAWTEFAAFKTGKIDTGQVTSGEVFGTPDQLGDNYLYRMAAAVLGIFGNSAEEAIYPGLTTDSDGHPLSGGHDYTLRLGPGQLPPVHAFWSVTMYQMPQSLLVDNPINRYLINSPMLPDLVKDSDGGVTIRVQSRSPGPGQDANWLPAPPGPFVLIMRLYWPRPEALNGTWQPPRLTKA